MSQVVLNVKRVVNGGKNFHLVINEKIGNIEPVVNKDTGELSFEEVQSSILKLNKKRFIGWLNSMFPGIAYLYGKKKEEFIFKMTADNKSKEEIKQLLLVKEFISASDLSVYLRDAVITVDHQRFTEADTYHNDDTDEDVSYNGVCYRSEVIDLEFSARIAPKIEALEDKAFEI